MKVVLVAINAKYIHTNLAVYLLKANTDLPVSILEFTIKDSLETMVEKILECAPDVVGFSVYIWNVSLIQSLTKIIKSHIDATVVWGGPEVSYDAKFFLDNHPVDYIICGEGELSFPALLHAIIAQSDISTIPNLAYREGPNTIVHRIQPIARLDTIKSPYHDSQYLEHLAHRIQYVEASRGCPYTCSYCLAALEPKVRTWSLDSVKSNLLHLMARGGRIFKFLDRTFNLDESRFLDLIDFIRLNHHDGCVFQFEITGDRLTDTLIDHLKTLCPPGLFRFEIGIQSTHDETNKLISRRQDTPHLFHCIRRLQKEVPITLHLDLIAGLPKENILRFEDTFNRTYNLFPEELQLGFLKYLRGTQMRRDAAINHEVFQEEPPYEVIETPSLSPGDLDYIKDVAAMLDLYHNKGFMPLTMKIIASHVASMFQFFREIGSFYKIKGYQTHRYQLFDVFVRLLEFTHIYDPFLQTQIIDTLKQEYLRHHSIKPYIWWDEPSSRKAVLGRFAKTRTTYPLETLLKYAHVITLTHAYLIMVYLPDKREEFIIEKTPEADAR
ncbi:MAG: DUF4080 domain-containing protein [Candidatus Izemoplasmatales bacterium]|jgi:radical SAM superfamily enzyme YgiQ (UPF0313 family)|nr:DUF4080 domain-containing protein [Candidatus Izemoplasmatales bacterium]